MATGSSGKIKKNPNSPKVHQNKFNQNHPGKKFIKHGRKPNKLLASLKRFGKRGNYGRGTDIEEEHFQYFLKILEALQKPATFDFERVSMAANVLEETKDKEVYFSSNQLVSRVIEAVIGYAGEEHFEKFLDAFGENFRPVCTDRYASHVLQKLVEVAFLRTSAENKIEENVASEEKSFKKREGITDYKYNMETKFSKDHREKCAAFVERVSKFLLNNLEDFVSDIFANYLMRSCINCLAGIHIPKLALEEGKLIGKSKPKQKSKFVGKTTLFKTPEAWHEVLKEFPSRLEMWPQLPDLVYKEMTSALLGVICGAISQIEKNALMRFGKKLLQGAFLDVEAAKRGNAAKREKPSEDKNDEENDGKEEDDSVEEKDENKEESGSEEDKNDNKDEDTEDELPAVFTNESSARLLECLISAASPKLYNEIYKTFFEGRIVELAKNKIACYPAKVILKQMNDKALFETVFDELVENFDAFLDAGNRALFPEISGACLRLNTKQAAFVTGLQSTLHCTTADGVDRPKSFLSCLLKFKRFEELSADKSDFVHVAGSIVAQDILRFKKPIFLVNCILEASPKDLANAIRSPTGSYVADAFLKSEFIGEKSREKFIKVLDGFYMDLALSAPGSRVLDNMFDIANEAQKVRIAKQLTTQDNRLKGNLFGRIMYNKLRLEMFKKTPEQWNASWNTKEKKEDKLNEIVNKKKRTESTSEEKNGDALNESLVKNQKKRTATTSEEKTEDGGSIVAKKKKKGSPEVKTDNGTNEVAKKKKRKSSA